MECSENNYKQTTEDEKSCVLYTDASHSKDLLAVLQCLRSREELCDVILIVGYSRISAHRAVLAGSSPYFRAMFAGNMVESELKEITLHIGEEDAFNHIINYFYTSNLEIKQTNVQELLPIAGLLQLRRVQKACCEFIRRNISKDNCLGVFAFADSHSCLELTQSAHAYAVNHFVDVVQTEEFMNINIELLMKLISDNALNVMSEERVFEACVAWLNFDPEVRLQNSAELFQHVRFHRMSAEYLMDHVAKEDIVRDCRKCSDLMLEAVRFQLLPNRRSLSPLAKISARKSSSVQAVLYAVGGMSRRKATKSAERFDPKEGRWKNVDDMNICRFGADIASNGFNIYICGGSDDASRLDTVERYDAFNNAWIPLASMSSKRNGVGVAVVGGKLFAIGGFDGSSPLNSTECYDPKVGKWVPTAPMMEARFSVGCSVLDEQIYAIGGSDGNNLKTCERYNVDTNKWFPVASLSIARKQIASASMGGCVYAMGGSDFAGRYQIVERYDPLYDQWVTVAPLLSPRSGAGAGVLDGFLYICGGFDGTQYCNTIERYDPLTDRWFAGPSMNQARDCVAVCVALHKKPKRTASSAVDADKIRAGSPVQQASAASPPAQGSSAS